MNNHEKGRRTYRYSLRQTTDIPAKQRQRVARDTNVNAASFLHLFPQSEMMLRERKFHKGQNISKAELRRPWSLPPY